MTYILVNAAKQWKHEKIKKELNNKQQAKKNVMYCNFILSFDGYVEKLDGESQDFVSFYLPIMNSERHHLPLMMKVIADYLDDNGLPRSQLYKVSSACNWDLFELLTGAKVKYIKAVNGKFYFGNRSDLDDFEKGIMKHFGFGTDFYHDAANALSKVQVA